MIEFKWSKVDKKNNNTPILKDTEIDEFAEILLGDYKPQLLKEPTAINYLHFLESYLGATVEFKDIYYEENEKPIFGATAFNEELLKIYDKENLRSDNIKLNARTIVIDNYVMQEGKEGLALFTGLHEGGHLWLHPEVYTRNNMQISLFGQTELRSVVCCRQGNVENFSGRKALVTAEDFREHQADYFASSIAMPINTLVPFVNEFLQSNGINDGRVITGIDYHHDFLAEEILPAIISETYGVSKQAALIRLKKLDLLTDKESYDRQNTQLKLI